MQNKERHLSLKLGRASVYILILVMVLCCTAVGSFAYIVDGAPIIKNVFTPSTVTCDVTEHFDGSVKSDVAVKNTGDTQAYMRVRLVSYRVNAAGEKIGGQADIPAFTPEEGWVKQGDYYYCKSPVDPKESTPVLIKSITLNAYPDGERQVIEVLAEAIQSTPVKAVSESWGWTPSGSGN